MRKNKKKREDTLQWILDKNAKVEEFKRQKELLNENQRIIANEINRRKEEYSQKFHQIFSKKNIDENTLNTIKEMFPNNPEINNLIDDYNEMNGNFNKKNNTSRIKNNNRNFNKYSNKDNIKNEYNDNYIQPIPNINNMNNNINSNYKNFNNNLNYRIENNKNYELNNKTYKKCK